MEDYEVKLFSRCIFWAAWVIISMVTGCTVYNCVDRVAPIRTVTITNTNTTLK